MRLNPSQYNTKAKSWFIEGRTPAGAAVSCSFVEFDERGDFLDFAQHTDCQARIRELVDAGPVLLVLYCHGWKNNSQSGDVAHFNDFLSRLADSDDMRQRHLRVHGVYLSWRGNSFEPYVDKSAANESYQRTLDVFQEPIIDAKMNRDAYWTVAIPETLSYWNRKGAAEDKVSGLPMARAIFTYAATAKGYGRHMENRVCVIGHSFGALMLEQSLGQAMTGALIMEWWETGNQLKVPFDLVLFVNSAAPSIYAKEMRDFLKAHRSALARRHDPDQEVPVIVSLTSTADWATGVVHPLGNVLAPLDPSLKRQYTNGIFGGTQSTEYPMHRPIRQSAFYTKTPGHQPYLINHWIVKQDAALLPANLTPAAVFSANLSTNKDPDLFYTSQGKSPAAAWRIERKSPGDPVTLDGLLPSMPDSNYWIISCGKELIGGHNDIWSVTAMEMYAAIYRSAQNRRGPNR